MPASKGVCPPIARLPSFRIRLTVNHNEREDPTLKLLSRGSGLLASPDQIGQLRA